MRKITTGERRIARLTVAALVVVGCQTQDAGRWAHHTTLVRDFFVAVNDGDTATLDELADRRVLDFAERVRVGLPDFAVASVETLEFSRGSRMDDATDIVELSVNYRGVSRDIAVEFRWRSNRLSIWNVGVPEDLDAAR